MDLAQISSLQHVIEPPIQTASSTQVICLVGLMFSGYLQQNTKVGSSRKAEADQEQERMLELPKGNSTAE